MSILIKGMKMPISCYKCDMRRRDGMDIVCPVAHERFSVADVNILEYRLDNFPLVPVPEPHGRLIDADAAAKQGWTISRTYSASLNEMVYEVKTMTDEVLPTIIPAEEGET